MKVLLTTLNSKHIHSSLALRYLQSYCADAYPELIVLEYTINQEQDYILGDIYKGNYQESASPVISGILLLPCK